MKALISHASGSLNTIIELRNRNLTKRFNAHVSIKFTLQCALKLNNIFIILL